MQSKAIIFFALVAVVFAEKKESEVSEADPKKDKRGLFDLGYGYGGYGSDFSLGSFSGYSAYPTLSHGQSTVITKEVAVPVPQPYPVAVEKRIAVPVKVPYAVPVDRPYPVHVPKPYPVEVTKHVPYPVDRPVLVPYAVKVPQTYPGLVKHSVPITESVDKYGAAHGYSSW